MVSDADYLKWAAVECAAQLNRCGFDIATDNFSAAMAGLGRAREVLRMAVDACSEPDPDHYSDGRRVASRLELGGGRCGRVPTAV